MHNFKELKVWQISKKLVKEVYEIASTFPSAEKLDNLTIKVSEIQKMTFGLIKTLRQESYV